MILLAALLGCAPPAAPAPVVQAAPPPPPALPGSEALRVSVDRVDARQHFDSAAPFVWEFHVPPGVVIPGEGLPPDVGGTSDLAPWYRDEAQRSIVQLEVPASRTGLTDEEAEVGSNTNFDPARFCRVGDPACLWSDDDDGRWRAWRVRSEANQVTTTELQLAHTWLDPQGETPEAAWRIIGLWLDAGALPLDEYDRIRFEYVGSMPAKATTWLDHRPMRPRLRYRPAAGSPCPGSRYACWTLLDDSDVQPVEVLPGRARWLQIIAPLDTRAGVPFDVRLISLDEWSNPAPLDGYLQLQINGRPASGPIGGGGRWTATATLTARTPGMYMLSVNPPAGVTGIAQYTRVWDAAAMPYDRKIGDVHVHSGLDGSVAFALSSLHGDHRGNFVHADDAMRYLREVAGYDFGALSEHAVWFDAWASTTADPVFGPGGACAVTAADEPAIGDWWTTSQQIALDAQRPGFTVFPAYEWHGAMFDAEHGAKLHRIALFRDHRPGAWDLPMLPGNVPDRGPQCLFRWLDDHGFDNRTALVLPHMMLATPRNDDWALTYTPSPYWTAVADVDRAQHYQTVGELFSARNHAYGTGGFSNLVRFEGTSAANPGSEPYAFRVGWRDTEAVIGVIGSSDNHVGTPGANDWDVSHPDAAAHEPGGAAFVLADPSLPTRDGIYEALRSRATYATSGLRAQLDWTVSRGPITVRMGAEVDAGDVCSLDTWIELATGQNIRTISIWGAKVGSPDPWVPILFNQPVNRTLARVNDRIDNPVPSTGERERWVYFVRAFTGPQFPAGQSPFVVTQNHREAVWSSPIWVEWDPARCP